MSHFLNSTDTLIQQRKAYRIQVSVSRLRRCKQSDSVLFCMKCTCNETNLVYGVLNKQLVWNLIRPTSKKESTRVPHLNPLVTGNVYSDVVLDILGEGRKGTQFP